MGGDRLSGDHSLSGRKVIMPITGTEYIVIFKVIPSSTEYAPITIKARLPEAQALILMATPIQSVWVGVQRAGGMLVDSTQEALDFDEGGN